MKPRGAEKVVQVALAAVLVVGAVAPGAGSAGEEGATAGAEAPAWEWGPSVLVYVLRDQPDLVQPTLTVDRGWLHLEGRYNYEARNTGSAWIGWNLAFGEELKVGITPMVGGVFGEMRGIAAGFTFTLEWGPLALWSQAEYVFDLRDSSQSFAYDWTELSVTGPDWLRVGLVLQRTRAFQTTTEVQGGPLAGVSFWKLSATVYFFAPGHEDQFVVLSAAGAF